MSSETEIADSRQILGRLARDDSQGTEDVSVVASPGARVSAWPVKVKGLSSYNVYNVRTVIIGEAGSIPAEIGGQMQAVNLAESFINEGQLPAGTYAVMFKVGDKNIFYAPV
jgi:hypothetical protein